MWTNSILKLFGSRGTARNVANHCVSKVTGPPVLDKETQKSHHFRAILLSPCSIVTKARTVIVLFLKHAQL